MGGESLGTRWKLSRPSALANTGLVAANVLLATAVMIATFWQGNEFAGGDEDPEVSIMASIGAVMHLVGIYCTGILVAGYIYVSFKARRPSQLHSHGLVLMLMLHELVAAMVADVAADFNLAVADLVCTALTVAMFGIRRSIFLILMQRKFAALGPPTSRCSGIRLWGKLLVASTFAVAFLSAVPGILWQLSRVSRGLPYKGLLSANPRIVDVEPFDQVVIGFCFYMGILGAIGTVVASCGVILVTCHLVRHVVAELVLREVAGKQLADVRSTLRQHHAGLLASLLTSLLALLLAGVDGMNTLERRGVPQGEAIERLLFAWGQLFDTLGDLVGILLLSGIGVLLVREDPDAGDINGRIRSVLYSAALTGRADVVFEGHVATTTSKCCIVSFPGAYLADWNALTWMCRQGEMSSACVFLPKSDTQQRFGKHVPCPDTPGKCWCHSLYGAEQPWGCMWFHVWKENLEKAVELGIELVVVFFPKQAGQGKVAWDDLGTPDRSDGLGLGRSQKAEVAYLMREGYGFSEEDVDAFRARREREGVRPT